MNLTLLLLALIVFAAVFALARHAGFGKQLQTPMARWQFWFFLVAAIFAKAVLLCAR